MLAPAVAVSPTSGSHPPRVRWAEGGGLLERAVWRRGGRVAQVEGVQAALLPEVFGGMHVLAPVGRGAALLAERVAGRFCAVGTGAVCAPVRWRTAGGVAAWIHAPALPRGPSEVPASPGVIVRGDGAWLSVAVGDEALAAALAARPEARGSALAVLRDGRVVALTPMARARGLARGMGAARARRLARAGGVTLVRDAALVTAGAEAGVTAQGPVLADVRAWLGDRSAGGDEGGAQASGQASALARGGLAGGVHYARGVLTVRLDLTQDAVAVADALVLRLWQVWGVVGRVAVASLAGDSAALVRLLAPGQVAVVPVEASGAWGVGRAWAGARVRLGARACAWEGRALEDVEGIVARCAALAQGVEGRALQVLLAGVGVAEPVEVCVDLPRGADPAVRRALVEDAVRRQALTVGPVRAITVRAARRTRGSAARTSGALARAAS